jgi:TonB family protein
MSVISTGTIFNHKRTGRWKTFLAGLAIDLAGVSLLVVVGPRFATEIPVEQVSTKRYVALVAPVEAPLIQPKLIQPPPALPPSPRVATLEERQPIPPPKEVTKQVSKLEVSKQVPKVEPEKVPPVPPPTPTVAAVDPAPLEVKPAPAVAKTVPPTEIKASGFGGGKSETATVHQPVRQVQTGGFGDPNGVPAQNTQNRSSVTVASVGSFELPSGPGKGNGTGGSHGVSGTVQSSGFGNARASAQPGHGVSGTIVASGFGERVAQNGGVQRVAAKSEEEPVEIVFKPRPDYTAEAIRRHVEGEVLLDVVFGATGSVHVNRVVKGLGYGLDDQALAVAEKIRFKPARKDGQPYDCAALVHIVFELTK